MARKQTEAMSYGIIGLGRFGSALAATLAEADKELMVLDRSEEKIRQARNYTEHAYVVKVVVCIGDKVDVSILTTLNVINLGVPQVVAKANSPEQGEILEKIGAQVVYPERDMAVRLARRLISKRIFNLFELDQNVDISEIKTTRKLTGQSVRDAQLRNRYGINIIAITRGGWLTTDVSPDYVFQDEDTVIVIGEREKIKRLADDLAR